MDHIYIKGCCPNCDHELTWSFLRTPSAVCGYWPEDNEPSPLKSLPEIYDVREVPYDLAEKVKNYPAYCCGCGNTLRLTLPLNSELVEMRISR